MKIYLAAPYVQMELMRTWAKRLEAAGHIITAKWIHGNEEGMTLHDAAQMNLDDIDAADAVVSMTLPKGTMFSGGGRHVEFGYGFARNKLMLVVSDHAENIFHEHDSVVKCPALMDVIDYLKQENTNE